MRKNERVFFCVFAVFAFVFLTGCRSKKDNSAKQGDSGKSAQATTKNS